MTPDKPIHYRETRFGFEYGAAAVERACSHNGYVVILVKTPHQWLEVQVTPAGRVIRTKQFPAPKFDEVTT